MDALVALQYRYLLALLAGAVVVGVVAARVLRRPGPPSPTPSVSDAHEPMLALLVALLGVTAILLMLPVLMILRYFPHWRVAAIAAAGVLVLLAPFAYAWRARGR
jgi:hypothetical protein